LMQGVLSLDFPATRARRTEEGMIKLDFAAGRIERITIFKPIFKW
jgi:hypothetical protein